MQCQPRERADPAAAHGAGAQTRSPRWAVPPAHTDTGSCLFRWEAAATIKYSEKTRLTDADERLPKLCEGFLWVAEVPSIQNRHTVQNKRDGYSET